MQMRELEDAVEGRRDLVEPRQFGDRENLVLNEGACFLARQVGGELMTTEEAAEVAWVTPERLTGYDIFPAIRRRLAYGLAGGQPHVD